MKILVETGGRIDELPHEAFEDEAKLQRLLEQHPGLVLAGTSDGEDRSIWAIGYEVPVPAGAIDLLLLDSTGHVWVVETKLAKNPEVRKQVVGQVLAYAADVATWGREDLEHHADGYLGAQTPPTTLRDLLASREVEGAPVGPQAADELIDLAIERLRKGDLTALIVVDELNTVLRRLVEFVNTSARFTLLALKIETVNHAGDRLFIPTVVGVMTTTRPPDEKTYEELLEAAPEQTKELALRLDTLRIERGWSSKVAKKSRNFQHADGRFLFWFHPGWNCIIFDLGHLRRHGHGDRADRIQALATEIEGRPQGAVQPSLGAERLLERWGAFVGELLPLLLGAVEE